MVRVKSLPGWRRFDAFAAHLKFIADHHRQIERIAVLTDSASLKIIAARRRTARAPGSQSRAYTLAGAPRGRAPPHAPPNAGREVSQQSAS
jgi:hypothetical protein